VRYFCGYFSGNFNGPQGKLRVYSTVLSPNTMNMISFIANILIVIEIFGLSSHYLILNVLALFICIFLYYYFDMISAKCHASNILYCKLRTYSTVYQLFSAFKMYLSLF